MPSELTTRASVRINAPASKVWEALTTPELISRWLFGVTTETDWTVGSPILHRGEYQDRPYEDRGTILEVRAERLIRHAHWSPVSGLPDTPEHYQEVSWSLFDDDGSTEVTVTEVNRPSDSAKDVSDQAWQSALAALKELLEGRGS
jgi:uncharacterized protein YndB with AHSA1/START domain